MWAEDTEKFSQHENEKQRKLKQALLENQALLLEQMREDERKKQKTQTKMNENETLLNKRLL
jgi:hypothetical protein